MRFFVHSPTQWTAVWTELIWLIPTQRNLPHQLNKGLRQVSNTNNGHLTNFPTSTSNRVDATVACGPCMGTHEPSPRPPLQTVCSPESKERGSGDKVLGAVALSPGVGSPRPCLLTQTEPKVPCKNKNGKLSSGIGPRVNGQREHRGAISSSEPVMCLSHSIRIDLSAASSCVWTRKERPNGKRR